MLWPLILFLAVIVVVLALVPVEAWALRVVLTVLVGLIIVAMLYALLGGGLPAWGPVP